MVHTVTCRPSTAPTRAPVYVSVPITARSRRPKGLAVDRREAAARLLHGDRGRLALQGRAPWPADEEEGIQGDGVACDQGGRRSGGARRAPASLPRQRRRGSSMKPAAYPGVTYLSSSSRASHQTRNRPTARPYARSVCGFVTEAENSSAANLAPGPVDDGRLGCVHRARQGKQARWPDACFRERRLYCDKGYYRNLSESGHRSTPATPGRRPA